LNDVGTVDVYKHSVPIFNPLRNTPSCILLMHITATVIMYMDLSSMLENKSHWSMHMEIPLGFAEFWIELRSLNVIVSLVDPTQYSHNLMLLCNL